MASRKDGRTVRRDGQSSSWNSKRNDSRKLQVMTAAERPHGQVKKGAGRMPWHWEPMKDAISCEKLRGAAHEH